MPMWPTVNSVTVVPVNGWGNRLRAMAAGSLLARELGGTFRVAWRAEPRICPARLDDVFSGGQVEFLPYSRLRDEIGLRDEMPPKYLTESPDDRVVMLRGYDRGEQFFMEEFARLLASGPPRDVVIWAGNHFTFGSGARVDLERLRRHKGSFYPALPISAGIQGAATTIHRGDYHALHIRLGDRKHQAPSRERIAEAIESISETGQRWVVLGDDSRAVRNWSRFLKRHGCRVAVGSERRVGRDSVRDVQRAIAEWLVLAEARSMVYFQQSTFATEAADVVSMRGGRVVGVPMELNEAAKSA